MQSSDVSESAPVPKVRAPKIKLDDRIPRDWLAGSASATQIANGVNLLFPAGERFFIRSVRRYLDRIDDEALRRQIKGFFGQEGRHAHAHETFFEVLESQGYRLRPFLDIYEKVAFDWIEQAAPHELRLAVTVALEHFTAIMAENALTERFLDHAHPSMRALLLWHAAEEIEHKAVAFDVLRVVNPSYALRMGGLALAALSLGVAWTAATLTLAAQDGQLQNGRFFQGWRKVRASRPGKRGVFLRGIREYVRPDFHPSHNDNRHLADAFLQSAGLA